MLMWKKNPSHWWPIESDWQIHQPEKTHFDAWPCEAYVGVDCGDFGRCMWYTWETMLGLVLVILAGAVIHSVGAFSFKPCWTHAERMLGWGLENFGRCIWYTWCGPLGVTPCAASIELRAYVGVGYAWLGPLGHVAPPSSPCASLGLFACCGKMWRNFDCQNSAYNWHVAHYRQQVEICQHTLVKISDRSQAHLG